MKYQPPEQGPYELGLTAEVMYDVIDQLLIKHATKKDVIRFGRDPSDPSLALEKLWTLPPIRAELEDFVMDYFVGDLNSTFPGLTDLVKVDPQNRKQESRDYFTKLAGYLGSEEEAYNAVSQISSQIEKRAERFVEEAHRIGNIKGKSLRKRNARDAYGHLSANYQLLLLYMRPLLKQN